MDSRSDGVRGQSARPSYLFIAKTRDFPHEEHVTIEIWQCAQGFVNREVDILRRQSRTFHQWRWLGLANTLAVMIERKVPGDSKEPGPDLTVCGQWHRCSSHSQEDVPRQITRSVGLANRPAEVAEQAMLIGNE